ncbi:MAG: hypothetical protein IKQ93_03265 [Candidatus Methanomethylophilaceae archaeon]|nr:hypothetical protein [Candidatus Methanomethylophilaceae archaeon]MBR6911240.1 hypothetical protein [Candidatus Methanomethylophilaceae archaeon]
MGVVVKFSAGVAMTLLFVIAVPYITDTYIIPYIKEAVGDSGFLFISSQTLIQILIFMVMVGFMFLLGGGAVFRWFGVFGILGMIVAYYILGDVTRAIIPLVSIVIVWLIFTLLRRRKEKKKAGKTAKS